MEFPLLVMPMMTSQILKSVDFTKAQKFRYLENEILFFLQIKKLGIIKPCTHLHPAHFSLQLVHCNTLILALIEPKYRTELDSFLKFRPKSCLFWLQISTRGVLEMLILNLHLEFWNSDAKIYFRVNLGRKSQSCPFYLKIRTHGIVRCWFLFRH